MIIKTYFNKNNTIVNNSTINTSHNPVTELFYGGDSDRQFSRFIFSIDLTRLKELYSNGMYGDLTKLKHTLRMTNTGAFDKELMGGTTYDGKDRSSSFDLILFPIPDEWDEGVGYDYADANYIGTSNPISIDINPSNWYEPMTNNNWLNGEGIYGIPPVLKTIHFDHGNENINLDITNIVNSAILGTGNTLSLGLCYPEDLEFNTVTNDNRLQYVGFFTRHTQTFYEPFIESQSLNVIKDDRGNFFLDKNNKLYLYTNLGSQPTNLDFLPTVTIKDDNDTILITTTGTQESLGVYSIELNVPSTGQNDCTMYSDVWGNISINGQVRPDVELEFSVKSEGYFNIGNDVMENSDYGFSINGIKLNENIVRGDIRKVLVNAKIPFSVNQSVVIDNLEYRLYVKEGRAQYTVIDFTPVNVAFNQNFFLLDTGSLIPNTYYLELKYNSNYDKKILPEVFKFNVVSQSELRISQ